MMCHVHNFFLRVTQFYTLMVCNSQMHGGGVLIASFNTVCFCKHRHGVESFDECVWTEILIYYGLNLLTGKRHFRFYTEFEVITSYFHFFEKHLSIQNFSVILMGDFSTSCFVRKQGLSQVNCYYYSKHTNMSSAPPYVFLTADNA
jgi:hypothetical protein